MVSFTSLRREPELLTPARATPLELKYLSDIDNQRSLRFFMTAIAFFGGRPADSRDPVATIRSALREALVYFYPLAGRLRELPPDGRLIVECTAEGIAFVEADADVTLAELGEPLLPPYPCVEEFLCDDVGDCDDILGKPLAFFQVTRFKCGGLAVGAHLCHSMHDGFGMGKFIQAVCEIARGAKQPTVLPVWERELLTSHYYPQPRVALAPAANLLEYQPLADGDADDVMRLTPPGDMVGQYFFFGHEDIATIRRDVANKSSTVFELLAAVTWRCRTAALGYAPDKLVRFMFTCNAHMGWKRDPPIPRGYYGCALIFAVAETTAGELCGNPIDFALELVRKAKSRANNDEYLRSTVDLMASRKWPAVVVDRTFVVSDTRAVGDDKLDFGWGRRIAGGIPMAADIMHALVSYYIKCKGADGEDSTAVSMCLPKNAMDSFAAQMSIWSTKPPSRKVAIVSNTSL